VPQRLCDAGSSASASNRSTVGFSVDERPTARNWLARPGRVGVADGNDRSPHGAVNRTLTLALPTSRNEPLVGTVLSAIEVKAERTTRRTYD
jgi:hypothetical protein